LSTSWYSPGSLDSSVGFVVTPSKMPSSASPWISLTFPVSANSFIAVLLARDRHNDSTARSAPTESSSRSGRHSNDRSQGRTSSRSSEPSIRVASGSLRATPRRRPASPTTWAARPFFGAFSKRPIECLEYVHPGPQQHVIIVVGAAQTVNEPSDGRGFGLAVRGLFEVDVVHDAADMTNRGIGNGEPIAKGLERAVRAVVPEVGLERVEWNSRRHRARHAEHESRLRIDETTNEPGRRHPVDAGARSGNPILVLVGRCLRCGRPRWLHVSLPSGELIESAEECRHVF